MIFFLCTYSKWYSVWCCAAGGLMFHLPLAVASLVFRPVSLSLLWPLLQENRRKEPSDTDEQIASRINGELRFYDGITHSGLFSTPKWLRAAIEQEKRIMTIENPVFMY